MLIVLIVPFVGPPVADAVIPVCGAFVALLAVAFVAETAVPAVEVAETNVVVAALTLVAAGVDG